MYTLPAKQSGHVAQRPRPLGAMSLLLGALLGPIACTRHAPSESTFAVEAAPAVSPEMLAAARQLYTLRCAECHGPQGGGESRRVPAVNPRPQRLSDRVWQSNVTNARLAKAILGGGAAVGKSEIMPAAPELRDKPQEVQGLVALIRSFVEK